VPVTSRRTSDGAASGQDGRVGGENVHATGDLLFGFMRRMDEGAVWETSLTEGTLRVFRSSVGNRTRRMPGTGVPSCRAMARPLLRRRPCRRGSGFPMFPASARQYRQHSLDLSSHSADLPMMCSCFCGRGICRAWFSISCVWPCATRDSVADGAAPVEKFRHGHRSGRPWGHPSRCRLSTHARAPIRCPHRLSSDWRSLKRIHAGPEAIVGVAESCFSSISRWNGSMTSSSPSSMVVEDLLF